MAKMMENYRCPHRRGIVRDFGYQLKKQGGG